MKLKLFSVIAELILVLFIISELKRYLDVAIESIEPSGGVVSSVELEVEFAAAAAAARVATANA